MNRKCYKKTLYPPPFKNDLATCERERKLVYFFLSLLVTFWMLWPDIVISQEAEAEVTCPKFYASNGNIYCGADSEHSGDISVIARHADIPGAIDISHKTTFTEQAINVVPGIFVKHSGDTTGNAIIQTSMGTYVVTADNLSALQAQRFSSGSGDIIITATDTDITTNGAGAARGILAQHQGTGGGISIDFSGGSITTKGADARGIAGWLYPTNARAVGDRGNVDIRVSNSRIATEDAIGIQGFISGNAAGDIRITATGTDITTERKSQSDAIADRGILAVHAGTGGGISIDFSGGSITTKGDVARGIEGRITNTNNDGDISLRFTGGTMETSGDGSHGIYATHQGTGDVIITFGSSITTEGADSHGIYSSTTSGSSTVHIDGRVMGGTGMGAGVYISGGGSVTIGPNGFLGSAAEESVAIRSENGDIDINILSDDDRPWELLGGNIVNDGGETALAVNGMALFGSENGVQDVWAPSGLHVVRLNSDLDFSLLDFSQEEAWISHYHPRVGVHEALPGAIRRIHTVPCRFTSNRRVAVDICGGRGEYTPNRSDTGMNYTYDQRTIQAHLKWPLSDQITGWLGGRLVNGEAEVSTTVGQGKLKVRGPGLYGGVHLERDNNYYGEARVSWSRYDAELSAGISGNDDQLSFASNTEGKAYSLELEAGRHFALENGTKLTGRGWYHLAGASVDPFDDSQDTSVSAEDKQGKVGLGLNAVRERELVRDESYLVLRGGIGLEQVLSDDSMVTIGEATISNAARKSRLLLDVGGEYHRDNLEIHGEVFAHGLAADDTIFGLKVGMNWSF